MIKNFTKYIQVSILSLAVIPSIGLSAAPEYLSNGFFWGNTQRQAFYSKDQGSQLMPYQWLKVLKLPNGTPFLANKLQRYGFLPNELNITSDLPIGLTKVGGDVGVTCAGCHTRQIEVSGKSYRIDGGPALIDFQSFLSDLDKSMGAVVNNPVVFNRFATDNLGATLTSANKAVLKKNILAWYTPSHTLMSRSLPQKPWGVGRLDAISMIFNRLSGLDIGEAKNNYMIPENIQPATAPTRYPFLWNASRQDHIEWLGFMDNGDDLTALLRNQGEVMGVFGKFHPFKGSDGKVNYRHDNSTNFVGLHQAEDLVKVIPAPKWPWAKDPGLVRTGKVIYKNNCYTGCHEKKLSLFTNPINLVTDPLRATWATPVQDVGTDIHQWSIGKRQVKTGVLEGESVPFLGIKLKAFDSALSVLETASYGSIIKDSTTIGWLDAVGTLFASDFPPQVMPINSYPYEARVLEGIWAAAPYLHNGSVPTMTELLKKPSDRISEFKIGPNYDTVNVGLAVDQVASKSSKLVTTAKNLCTAGKSPDLRDDSGNSRCGHDYGTNLTNQQKKALIEYLKTL